MKTTTKEQSPVQQVKCEDHSGLCSRTLRNEDDIQRIWKAIDQMRTWVILGMASLLLQVGLRLFDKFLG